MRRFACRFTSYNIGYCTSGGLGANHGKTVSISVNLTVSHAAHIASVILPPGVIEQPARSISRCKKSLSRDQLRIPTMTNGAWVIYPVNQTTRLERKLLCCSYRSTTLCILHARICTSMLDRILRPYTPEESTTGPILGRRYTVSRPCDIMQISTIRRKERSSTRGTSRSGRVLVHLSSGQGLIAASMPRGSAPTPIYTNACICCDSAPTDDSVCAEAP